MNLKSEDGFTFVELLITIGVVVFLLVGFLGSITALQSANTAAYERSIALQDANRVIETLRNAALTGTFPANVTSVYPDGVAVSGYTSLTNQQVLVDYANASSDPLDTTVTVNYSENGRRAVSVTLRTYITKRS